MKDDQFEQLRQVVARESLSRRLNNLRRDIFKSFFDNETGPEVSKLKDGKIHPQESPLFLSAAERFRPQLAEVLAVEVLTHLDRPRIVTIDDLWRSFLHQLIVRDDEYEHALVRFQRSMLGRVRMVSSKPVPIAFSEEPVVSVSGHEVLWQNTTAAIKLVGPGPVGAEQAAGPRLSMDKSIVLYAGANLYGSARAADELESELGPLLRSTVFSFSQLVVDKSSPALRGILPYLCDAKAREAIKFVSECLNIFYAKQPKKDSVDLRLRNAILLLTEADRQRHFAIALSLCFSAMEAMLGRGASDIVAKLSADVATLLEPPNARRTAAKEKVRKLYNIRSKVLHGASLDHDPKTLIDSRLLAAAVLKAFLERRAFSQKNPTMAETPEQIFDALENAQLNGQRVEGVNESAARRLWENES